MLEFFESAFSYDGLAGVTVLAVFLLVSGRIIDGVVRVSQSRGFTGGHRKGKSSAMDFKLSGSDDDRSREADKLKLPSLKDVAGLSEVKEDLMRIMKIFREGKTFKETGAVPPTGILFYGAPGCGKTMLAKAIARECNVNFIARNAGELCRRYNAGFTDNPISSLFKEARKNAPCVVFIDELDIFGTRVNTNPNQEQLTELIAEMDGFAINSGILIIGATNNIRGLDPALLRSGRFTKKYNISAPQSDRDIMDIINMYCNRKSLDGVSDAVLVRLCRGMTPSDIKAMFQISSSNSVMVGKKVTQVDLLRVKAELQSSSQAYASSKYTRKDIERRIAIHEAGHTIISMKYGRLIEGVNILGVSGVGGYTSRSLEDGEGLMPISFYLEEIAISYGGVANEEVMYGSREKVSLGCISDLGSVSELLSFLKGCPEILDSGHAPLCYTYLAKALGSQAEFREQLLPGLRDLADSIYEETKGILDRNRDVTAKLVDLLIERKEISSVDVEEFFSKNPIK